MKCFKVLFIVMAAMFMSSSICDDGPTKSETLLPLDDGFEMSFNWRDEGIMTPAKQQGAYGTCGVFAAMGVFEALIKRETGVEVDLSEQYYVNLSTDWTAAGNNPIQVFEFLQESGVVLEARLPYEAQESNTLPEGEVDYKLSSFGFLALEDKSAEQARVLLKQALIDHGPLAVAMDLQSDLFQYTGGIYVPSASAYFAGGHWVVLLGWQDDIDVLRGGYWIVKNSDGDSWGEEGYFNIPYNTCNLDRYVYAYGVYER
ncbi:hypothetical protein KAR48_09565 [bacterium]|nr:hypothetical protein [bacterium]